MGKITLSNVHKYPDKLLNATYYLKKLHGIKQDQSSHQLSESMLDQNQIQF